MKFSSIFKDKKTVLFIVLAGFFVVNTILAEFIGVKIFSLEKTLGIDYLDLSLWGNKGLNLNLTAGVILWPIVFVLTDVINEYFGIKGVRFLTNLTIVLIIYSFVIVFIAIQLFPNDWWQFESGNYAGIHDMNMAFKMIFGQGLWIIIGSLVAFLVGQIVDVYIFQWIKKKTNDSKLWLRATGSTLISQFIDSYIVLFIAFYMGADWDLTYVLAIGTINYLYKSIVAVIMTPIIYVLHGIIDNQLGLEVANKLKHEAKNK